MKKTIRIIDKDGLHARPASQLTKLASEYPNDITLTYNDKEVPLKSILAVMSLSIPSNATVSISVDGDNASDVLETLVKQFVELELISEDSA